MQRRSFLLAAAGAALAACSRESAKAPEPAPEAAAGPDPVTAIRPLYDRYLTPNAVFPPLENQAPWSSALQAQLQTMMARSEAINEPILDFDPLIGAQDYELTNLNVTADGVVYGSHAVVRASFTNLGEPREILYDLIWENGAWRVDNVRGADFDLRQIAASGATEPAAP